MKNTGERFRQTMQAGDGGVRRLETNKADVHNLIFASNRGRHLVATLETSRTSLHNDAPTRMAKFMLFL